jgi:hypothetical protein
MEVHRHVCSARCTLACKFQSMRGGGVCQMMFALISLLERSNVQVQIRYNGTCMDASI